MKPVKILLQLPRWRLYSYGFMAFSAALLAVFGTSQAEGAPGSQGLSARQVLGLSSGFMQPFGLPPGPAQSKNPQAEVFRQRGAMLYNAGNYQAAAQFFRQALLLEPANQAIRYELLEAERALKAMASAKTGDFENLSKQAYEDQKAVRNLIDKDAVRQKANSNPTTGSHGKKNDQKENGAAPKEPPQNQ